MIEELENLYLEKHYDFNFEHFYEEHVYNKYDISYDTMLKRFKKDDIISVYIERRGLGTVVVNEIRLYADVVDLSAFDFIESEE